MLVGSAGVEKQLAKMSASKRNHDEADAQRATRPRLKGPESAGDIVDRITAAVDWRDLFDVSPQADSSEEVHVAARTVRNRLVRVAHPDRTADPEQMQRHTVATANLNRLWGQAMRHFDGSSAPAPAGEPAPPSTALQFNGSSPPPAMMMPMPPPSTVEPSGALEMLRSAVTSRPPLLLERPELSVFVGFGSLETLRGCKFLPMATNRCISQDVVAQRVAQNLQRLRARGSYHDFGQISLVAVRDPPSEQFVEEGGQRYARFYVLDGQHRLTVMGELARERPNMPICFELSVKVVPDKASANAALLHMQHCYAPDPKCFFEHDDEAEIASRTLDLAKLAWPAAFAASAGQANRSAFARPARPTIRPKLDDGLFFDVLRDTRLLHEATRGGAAMHDGSPLLPSQRPRVLFDALRAVNDAIRGDGPPGSVAQRTFADCRDKLSGCFLGLYRRDDTGAKILELLKEKGAVPKKARCPRDAD